MKDETFWIYSNDEVCGPYSLKKLYDMRMCGEIPGGVQFWSNRRQDWFPLSGIICDEFPPAERISDMVNAGVSRCEIIGSGDDSECPSCKAIVGRVFPLSDLPVLPPVDCKCTPWFRGVVIAAG